jgi:hypothetical protein
MKVDNISEIGATYRKWDRYIQDTINYIAQQRMGFPLSYNEYRILKNKEIVNNLKKQNGL